MAIRVAAIILILINFQISLSASSDITTEKDPPKESNPEYNHYFYKNQNYGSESQQWIEISYRFND